MTVLVSVGLLAVGLPASYFLFGLRAETLAAAPIVGGVCAGMAAVLELVLGGDPAALMAVVVLVVTVVAWRFRPEHARADVFHELGVLAVVAAALVWPLRGLRTPDLGWDGRSIWLLHARWFLVGKSDYLRNAHSPVASIHADYPPLAAQFVAVVWHLSGGVDLRVGQVLIGCLTAAATVLAGLGLARAVGRSRAVGVVAGAVLVVVLYGVWEAYAFNGFMDPLAAALGLAAMMYGLLAPSDVGNLSLALLCALGCAWTKNEGLVLAVLLLVAIGIRFAVMSDVARSLRRPRLGAIALTAVASMFWWTTVRARGLGSDLTSSAGRVTQSPTYRARVLFAGMHKPVALVTAAVVLCALIGWLSVRQRRIDLALAVSVMLADFAVVIGVYLFGPREIHYWVTSSLTRTMMFFEACTFGVTMVAAAAAANTLKDSLKTRGGPLDLAALEESEREKTLDPEVEGAPR